MEDSSKLIILGSLFVSILMFFFGAITKNNGIFFVGYIFFVVFIAGLIIAAILHFTKGDEDDYYERPVTRPEVIKKDNSSKSGEQKSGSPIAGILVSVTFLIIGVAIYIYGDYMSSKYQLMHSLLHMYNSEYAQYAFMKIIGSVVAIVGLLGIIITPFMKR
ncbi:hypothetical protein [Methanoplanus limicola]|uniref:Uncharacterized protein n=1 Tax=Methanoplanus limicola DSM 2279 TaxID=937775 RepID=H1Z181_9EURY|nr:hypothetical protein [Methanoplanus limicola]EHQ35348.1 hypothetical protein Metlim_1238 [Methanoplanus limicola DSM 2279]